MGERRARCECSEVHECKVMRADRCIVPSGGILDLVYLNLSWILF